MANPTLYAPSYDFSNFAAENPSRPLPGVQVDIQFQALEQTTSQTIAALEEVRRSDGKLKNGVVTPDSLSAGLVMGFTVEGEWTDGDTYQAADGVSYGTSFYKSRVAHTATSANRPDIDSTTWGFLFTFDSIVVGDNAITTAKIADLAVTAAKIAVGAITAEKLAGEAITAAELASDAVTTAKIQNSSVTTAKLADAGVTTGKLADTSVTSTKLAADAITTAKILDANVTTAKLADFGVTTTKLAANSVTLAKIAAGTIVDVLIVPVVGETATVTTGAAKRTFRMPYAFALTAVRASLTTVSSSGTPTVDINEGGSSLLSTKLTIDANEKSSTTAATAAVISDASLADDAEITIDVDVAGTGAKGLKVYLIGYRT